MRKWQVFGDQSIHLQIGVRSLHQFGRGRQSKRPRGNLSFIIRFDYSHSFQLTIIAFFSMIKEQSGPIRIVFIETKLHLSPYL